MTALARGATPQLVYFGGLLESMFGGAALKKTSSWFVESGPLARGQANKDGFFYSRSLVDLDARPDGTYNLLLPEGDYILAVVDPDSFLGPSLGPRNCVFPQPVPTGFGNRGSFTCQSAPILKSGDIDLSAGVLRLVPGSKLEILVIFP